MHLTRDQALPARDAAAIACELKDREEVVDALYRFAQGLDLQDRQLLASALAADAELDSRSAAAKWGAYSPLMIGRDTIVNLLLGLIIDRVDTTHVVTNPRVQVDGDTARFTAMVQAKYLLRADHDRHALLTNRYTLDLARDGAHWVMHRVHIETAWYTGDPADVLGG
ncbi:MULTISPECIES: nuclear transport factor 2 family protein [Thermomonosporaceae]|uniref:nuclear transport factor 2 family protein n=1 Tax=Thermomonosporaceae TaxID=2012 RepID=UPI00255AB9C6|nr:MULTISPECIES: nuclear transport factor 2 family protein [Thermomonosporaceae]MDL4776752.1 nuclear transport factor 2 family protein [Actinomadura xylanilytica]